MPGPLISKNPLTWFRCLHREPARSAWWRVGASVQFAPDHDLEIACSKNAEKEGASKGAEAGGAPGGMAMGGDTAGGSGGPGAMMGAWAKMAPGAAKPAI